MNEVILCMHEPISNCVCNLQQTLTMKTLVGSSLLKIDRYKQICGKILVASFPGLLTVQFLIACSICNQKLDGGKAWEQGAKILVSFPHLSYLGSNSFLSPSFSSKDRVTALPKADSIAARESQ